MLHLQAAEELGLVCKWGITPWGSRLRDVLRRSVAKCGWHEMNFENLVAQSFCVGVNLQILHFLVHVSRSVNGFAPRTFDYAAPSVLFPADEGRRYGQESNDDQLN